MDTKKLKTSIINTLCDIGLDKKQAEIYFACYQNGPASIQQISHQTGIKRTTLYGLLEDLEKINTVKIIKRDGKTLIEAYPPESLIADIKKRGDLLSNNLYLFDDIKKETDHNLPKITYYRGKDGFRKFWRDLLDSGIKEWLIITSGKEFLSFVSDNYIKRVIAEKKRKGIKSRQIISDSSYAREIVKKDLSEFRESRIAGSEYPIKAIEIIFGTSVALISSNYEGLFVVIDSQEVSTSHRSLFELLWNKLG